MLQFSMWLLSILILVINGSAQSVVGRKISQLNFGRSGKQESFGKSVGDEQVRDVNVINIFIGHQNASHTQNFNTLGQDSTLGMTLGPLLDGFPGNPSNQQRRTSDNLPYDSPPRKSQTCFTLEKRALQNKPCVFPFKYKGKIYNGCITVNDPEAKAWCSTEVDNDGYHILNQEFWGHCSSTCYVDIEGFAIGTVQVDPSLGPRLKPSEASGLTDAALAVVEGSKYTGPVSFPSETVTQLNPQQYLEIPNGLEWFKSAQTGGTWSFNCKFTGNDKANYRIRSSDCIIKCKNTFGCTHFTATSGICFLKKNSVGKGSAVYVENAVCGFI